MKNHQITRMGRRLDSCAPLRLLEKWSITCATLALAVAKSLLCSPGYQLRMAPHGGSLSLIRMAARPRNAFSASNVSSQSGLGVGLIWAGNFRPLYLSSFDDRADIQKGHVGTSRWRFPAAPWIAASPDRLLGIDRCCLRFCFFLLHLPCWFSHSFESSAFLSFPTCLPLIDHRQLVELLRQDRSVSAYEDGSALVPYSHHLRGRVVCLPPTGLIHPGCLGLRCFCSSRAMP